MNSARKPIKTPKPATREILLWWGSNQLSALVPKRRGAGFLKVPYGHHHDPALEAIAQEAGCDLVGLDGSLDFQCGAPIYHGGDAVRQAFLARIVPALEAHYAATCREVNAAEFWSHLR